MKLQIRLPRAVVLAVVALVAFQAAGADTPVATIYGVYDSSGLSNLPSSAVAGLTPENLYNPGDTPSLYFLNTSGFNIANAQMMLSVDFGQNNGQNTLNQGQSQTVGLGTLGMGTATEVTWGSSGPLFNYDYDDSYSSWNGAPFAGNSGSFGADCTLNAPGVHPEWTNYCSPVGNFLVQFSGTLMDGSNNGAGQSVAAVFSEYDVNNVYTGWEGVDPNGWSENASYDVHAGTVSGILANIYLGTVGTVPTSPNGPSNTVPEPATLALVGIAAAACLLARRQRKI